MPDAISHPQESAKQPDNFMRWVDSLLREEGDRATFNSTIQVRSRQWSSDFQSTKLDTIDSCHLVRSEVMSAHASPFEDDGFTDLVSCRFVRRGRYGIKRPDETAVRLDKSQGVLFSPKSGNGAALFTDEGRLDFLAMVYSLETLEAHLDAAPTPLLKSILAGDHAGPCLGNFPVSEAMHRLVETAFVTDFTGSLKRLFLEGLCQQLLAWKIQVLTDKPTDRQSPGVTRAGRDRAYEARARLFADLTDPPSIKTLAREIGTTEKTLNKDLRATFGQTAFQLLKNRRLDMAKELLETDSYLLKEVAYRAGYGHVTNFINAFTQRFGEPPRQLTDKLRR